MEKAKGLREIAFDVIPPVAHFGLLAEGPKCSWADGGRTLPCPKKCSLPFEKPARQSGHPTLLNAPLDASRAAKEARNTPLCPSQEKFHTGVLRGLRNTSEAP